MITAILLLLSSVGSWMAWRRNPAYKATATFRVLGEVVLLLIAAGCILYFTVHLTQKQSVAVQLGVLLTMIPLVTLGLIFSISALTTPKSARLTTALPPDVPILDFKRRQVMHWAKVAGVFLAFFAALCLIGGVTRDIAMCFLCLGGLLSAVMLPTAYIMARRFDRSATALQLHPWLHWHYPLPQWQSWCAARVERLATQPESFHLKRDWRRLGGAAAGVLIGALVLTPGSWVSRVGWAALCLGLVVGFVELAAWDARRAPQKLRRRLERASPEVYFGDDGVVCDDRLLTWLGADVSLTLALFDERAPRSVLLEFQKMVPNPYGPPQTVTISQNVLIPQDAAPNDLPTLRSRLAARCPGARLML